MSSGAGVVLAAFLASMVEMVEASTIILAVGLSRGWRPALTGTALGILLLAGLVVFFRPLLLLIPLSLFQLIVGILLLLFGMRWLRKAILRAVGIISIHDEDKIFTKTTESIQHAPGQKRDYLAIVTAFKAMTLEGLEVIFIILAIGTTDHLMWLASLGAVAAALVVLVLSVVIHKPLSRVPENLIKYTVGIMLSAFGMFWIGEGLGLHWYDQDVSIIILATVLFLSSAFFIRFMRPRIASAV